MTREEAIAHGKEQLEVFGGKHREFIEMSIKALKQESILDKIKAEIEQTFLDDGAMQEYTVEECLRIIDKYKAESEDTESEDEE